MTRSRPGASGAGEVRPWTDVFRKSNVCPGVFFVRLSDDDPRPGPSSVLSGVPTAHRGGMFSNYYSSTPVLEGFLISVDAERSPIGMLPGGTRLVGFRPFRLVCHLLGLKAPRRLAGEPDLPDVADLVSEFEEQCLLPGEQLEERAALGLGVRDSVQLRLLALEVMGPDVVPVDAAMQRRVDANRRFQ